jgi:hypothetical protein
MGYDAVVPILMPERGPLHPGKMAERTELSNTTIAKMSKDFEPQATAGRSLQALHRSVVIEMLYDVVRLYLNPARGRGGAMSINLESGGLGTHQSGTAVTGRHSGTSQTWRTAHLP